MGKTKKKSIQTDTHQNGPFKYLMSKTNKRISQNKTAGSTKTGSTHNSDDRGFTYGCTNTSWEGVKPI